MVVDGRSKTTQPEHPREDVVDIVLRPKLIIIIRVAQDNGMITQYTISVSQDGTNFTTVATGTWPVDTTAKIATFAPVQAQVNIID